MLGLLARALVLLLVGAAVGLAGNRLRHDGVALRGYQPPATCSAAAEGALPVETLAPAEAARLCGDPRVLIADARPPERFAAGHVADAVHLPCAASGAQASNVLGRSDVLHTLIVYGDSTEEARPVAEDLRRRIGRPDLRVMVLEGGFRAWSDAGLACASGPCRTCAEARQ